MTPPDTKKSEPFVSLDQIFNLSEKVGVIIGGAGKMGQQFAGVLAEAGSQVILADQKEELIEQTLQNIKCNKKKNISEFKCDVSSEESVKKLFDFVNQNFGRLDFLINNAMAKPNNYYQTFEEYSLETWKEVLDINLTGAFLSCREAVPLMKKSGGGSIVMTSSIYGVVSPDQRLYKDCTPGKNPYGTSFSLNTPGVYSASKGGLISFSKYLATLLAPENIRVNVLIPGGVFDGQEESFHQAYKEKTPMNRMATWSDFNGAILFLVSSASRYMTGSNLIIDGGWTAW